MQNIIITPTFSGHFQYIKPYLDSFCHYATDKKDFVISFTISKSESDEFQKIICKYNNLNIDILFFEDLLKEFKIKNTPDELLQKYKKFSYQTLKKFYTMMHYGIDSRFLVLDSESMLIRKTNVSKLFDDFFKQPFISGSRPEKYFGKVKKAVMQSTKFILSASKYAWCLENFVWFYDSKILSDMIKNYGMPIEIIDNVYQKFYNSDDDYIGVFEIDLYQNYIYNNLSKYKYKFNDVDNIFKSFDKKVQINYKHKCLKQNNGEGGLFEHVMLFLNKDNVQIFANTFKDLNFNIIRCEQTTYKNYKLQKQFLNIVKPNILAASQNHCFGIKHNQLFKGLFLQSNTVRRFLRHFKMVIAPITYMLKWAVRLIFLPFDIILVFVKFITIVLLYFKK